MRILLLNQFFWPDSSATSQLLTDLARELAERGHEVTAISAEGGYASAADGEEPRVRRVRVKSLRFARGTLGRVLSYASFYLTATWRALRLPHQDMVLTLTTPPLLSLLGNAVKLLRGSRHFIWEMDVYPDVAVALGTFRAGGLLDKLVGFLADFSRSHADGVIALGECMKAKLVERGTDGGKIFVAENWADSRAIEVLPRPGDAQKLVLLYSGNLGLAHDLETIEGAMRELRGDARFEFVFVGSGGRRAELSAFVQAEALTSVQLRPYVQRESLGESLAAGDIGLVTQRDEACGLVVPSKVYGLLAAGRPILFIGPAEATPARLVREFGCGWHIPCGDVAGLTTLLERLARDRTEVLRAGEYARAALLKKFDRPLGVARIADILHPGSDPLTGRSAPVPEKLIRPSVVDRKHAQLNNEGVPCTPSSR